MGSFAASANTSFLLGSNTPVPSGTANGVLYLNGSKVPTSGSALTFDGTTFSAPRFRIPTGGFIVDSQSNVTFNPSAGGSLSITSNGSFTNGNILYNALAASGIHVWQINSGESMRLNSTGLGIGTNNPGARLDVNGGDAFFGNTANTAQNIVLRRNGATVGSIGTYNSQLEFSGGATLGQSHMVVTSVGNVGIGASSPSFKLQVEAVADGNAGIYARNQSTGTSAAGNVTVASMVGGLNMRAHSAANSTWPSATLIQSDSGFTGGLNILQLGANPILFWTNGSERMRLDASGNLGLGVTPSAWGGTRKAIQLGNPGQLASAGINLEIGSNWYNDGTNYRYTTTAPVSLVAASNGQHIWYTAPSGTAGNVISFTQAMTLNANGELSIGTTSVFNSGAGRGNISLNGSLGSILNLAIAGASTGYLFSNGTDLDLAAAGNQTVRLLTNGSARLTATGSGNIVPGTAALATNATDGFIYTPSCAGAPTGAPTAYTGRIPMVVDTTNLRVYFNIGGTWRYATLT